LVVFPPVGAIPADRVVAGAVGGVGGGVPRFRWLSLPAVGGALPLLKCETQH